ncbi:desulfoferrodoxin [Orenia metallireducens]|uniref:Desulfoferrodoxin n=1 Tax=Orenia metallireducens TaxID=1413210 RepID=A0A1C0AAR8_9FIRM|nr:desulfoferrodoxin [Orenia metallireducens]OCL27382.1 desulfoferrodoxin [Orenia metallireducens]
MGTKLREVYRCNHCGNVVEVVQAGPAPLVCCGEKMEKLDAQTADYTTEKHVPVVEEVEDGVKVTVGSTLHPMTEEHLIKFIEVLTEDKVLRAELEAGQEPVAEFKVSKDEIVDVREFCNLHGLWKA